MKAEHPMKETTKTRIIFLIIITVFLLGIWMLIRSASAQMSEPVCNPGDSTETCLALLDQKSRANEGHIDNTDVNVGKIVDDLKQIDKDIAEIKNNEAWERGIWGAIVSLLASGLFIVHIYYRKKETGGNKPERY